MSDATVRMIGGPMDGQLRAFPEKDQMFWDAQLGTYYRLMPDRTFIVIETQTLPPARVEVIDQMATIPLRESLYYLVENTDRHGPRFLYIHETLTGKDYPGA